MSSRGDTLRGWALSLLLHGLVLGGGLLLLDGVGGAPAPAPFRWDIALAPAALPAETSAVAPSQEPPRPAQAGPPRPAPEATRHETPATARERASAAPAGAEPLPGLQPVPRERPSPLEGEGQGEGVEHPAPSATPATPPVLTETTPASSSRSASAAATSPAPDDFSWVKNILLSRLEQFKQYPRLARLNGWEGKVVLQAIIASDGALVDLTVVESSGHSVLDREAQEAVRRACPLPLLRSLGRSQVTVPVPIRYRLEEF